MSPTQRELTAEAAAELVRHSLGPGRPVLDAAELGGGGFASVWRVRLADGGSVVLKTSPPPGATLLSYEHGLLAVEAAYYDRIGRELPGVPVPEVLHYGADRALCDGDWLVMSFLPGTPLSELSGAADSAGVRRELGRVLARVHTLEGPEFGYPGEGRRRAPSWRAAFLGIIDELLADAQRSDWDLPVPPVEIRRVVNAASGVLDLVRRPALVHFDLWDGNVLTTADADGTLRLSGLVDGERCLYGDPLVDLVSPVLFGAIEDEPGHPLLRGYAEERADGGDGQGGDGAWVWDEASVARVRLYRLWLYLVMNVEIPTRGMTGDTEGRAHRAALLRDALTAVEKPR